MTDLFLVGPNQTYKQVQEAIDALILEQGINPFTQTKRILITEDGSYKRFTVPTDALRPEATARLEIGSANGILAVISGNLTAEEDGPCNNGCLIGSNVPYVTIQSLYFRDFVKGIVFSVNCHNPIVEQCVILNSDNVGVWVYQSDNAQIVNNIIINSEFGVATTLAKNVSIIYNTIYNEPINTTSANACVYVELQRDRTFGILDTGTATLFNNILFSVSGQCILINERDLTNLQSDFNCIFTQSGNIARVRVELPNGDIQLEDVALLENWRQLTNWDTVSISEHPVFIQQDPEFGGSFIDLNLLPLSPCIAAGKLLCGDPDNDLPAYVDDTLLCVDILDKARGSQPTIGANEVSVQEGFFGLDIFTAIVPSEQAELVCGAAFSALDLSASQYANAVECWFPQVKSGYFFIREKPYYLYAQKAAYTLQNITRTTFKLAQPVRRNAVKILVAGEELTGQEYWRLDGNTLHINHLDLPIQSLNNEVLISGPFQEWNTGSQTFIDKEVNHRFRLKDGVQSYWLPSNPKDSGPVVITDDTVRLLDHRELLPMEFKTEWDATNEETELVFGPDTNIWLNPQFEYGTSFVDSLDSFTIDTGTFSTTSNPIRRTQEDQAKRHLLSHPTASGEDKQSPSIADFRVHPDFLKREINPSTTVGMVHHGSELPQDYEVITDGRIACRTVVQVDDKRPVRALMGRQFLVFDIPHTGEGTHTVAQDVKIDPDKNYFFSTYITAPNVTGQAQVTFEFLDHNGVTLQTGEALTYDIDNSQINTGNTGEIWERVGVSIGNQEDLTPGLPAVGINTFQTGLISIHTGAETMIVALSANSGDPVAYDCIQLEEGSRPTPYNRVPRGGDVTIEYEDSDAGFYTIKDLTVSPIRNPQSRGFLQIPPVPAAQFDTGAPMNVTTLTDWFWPTGRIHHLPWAKTRGINKWAKVAHFHTGYQGPTDQEFTWDLGLSEAQHISTFPATPVSAQDSSGDIFTIFIKDRNNNPYSFNPTRLELYEPNAEFPGYLAFREFGIPTRLGQVFTVDSNGKGVVSTQFIPPSAEDVEYRGDKPTIQTSVITGDLPSNSRSYGFIDTTYAVGLPNHGNITLHDQFANRISLRDTGTNTGQLSPMLDSLGNSHYELREFPVLSELKVFDSVTGVFDRRLERTTDPTVGFGQYFFDENTARITVRGASVQDLRVVYQRRLAWIVPEYPRRIYIDAVALDQATGDIVVNYDAQVQLKITAEAPLRTAGLPAKFRQVTLIAQNKFVGAE